MRKLIILCFAALAMVACGDMGSHNGDDNNHDAYSLPNDGYYRETNRYVNGVKAQAGSYEPQYAWVDEQNQSVHYKSHDGNGYHHNQDSYGNHGGRHGRHHSTGYGHDCYSTSDDSYENIDVDDDGNEVLSIFERISQSEYENVQTNN